MSVVIHDRVRKTGESYYPNLNFSGKSIAPSGTNGTILRLRRRYENTPNFYILYVVKFDGYEYTDTLVDQYELSSLQLIGPGEK